MISINMETSLEVQKKIALKVRAKRLSLNLSQQTLADRSGISFGVLKKFERTGQISLESLLKLAFALDSLDEFNSLFEIKKPMEITTLDELMQDNQRKRGRK